MKKVISPKSLAKIIQAIASNLSPSNIRYLQGLLKKISLLSLPQLVTAQVPPEVASGPCPSCTYVDVLVQSESKNATGTFLLSYMKDLASLSQVIDNLSSLCNVTVIKTTETLTNLSWEVGQYIAMVGTTVGDEIACCAAQVYANGSLDEGSCVLEQISNSTPDGQSDSVCLATPFPLHWVILAAVVGSAAICILILGMVCKKRNNEEQKPAISLSTDDKLGDSHEDGEWKGSFFKTRPTTTHTSNSKKSVRLHIRTQNKNNENKTNIEWLGTDGQQPALSP